MIDEQKIAEYTDAVSGSGKFENETVLTPYLYDLMMEGEGLIIATGRDGESATYFDLSDVPDAHSLVFNAHGFEDRPDRSPVFQSLLGGCVHILLIQNSDGFCTLEPFATESDARDATDGGGGFYFGPTIDDDDITISDLDEIPAVVERMNREGFYPNVWHINERGNTDLLSVNAETGHYEILKSWV
jgi:hypothetical protein